MRNFKKFLTLVLAVMMVVSSMAFTTSAATTKFEDVDADNEALVKAVDLLSYMGIAKGKSETNFGADELVTREQFALFMYRLMKGGKDAPAGASNTTQFKDLEDPTYFYAIAWATAEGIVKGKSNTTFGPKDPITLQEAYTMVVRALDWDEDQGLVYPFGFINVAEQDGVELDAGLASDLGYTDELTRGDMAIILYNAFFAETGIPEIVQKGTGTLNDGFVIVEEKVYNRLCENEFDVHELVFEVVATPNYELAVGGTVEVEATYDLGYEAMWLRLVEDNEINEDATVKANSGYFTAEDLGIEGDLNDYFLGEFTLFVTVDKKNDVDKVLFADCNMNKKTTSEIEFGTLKSTKSDSYFDQYTDATTTVETEAKLLSGELVVDGESIYVYNAPYTYANKAYEADDTDEDRYVTRNSENLKEISFISAEVEEDVVVYTAAVADILTDDYVAGEKFYADKAAALAAYFKQAYYGGLYEAELYDVNGDGLYDYVDYQEYSFFQVDSDEDETFGTPEISAETGLPYVYTNEATVVGEFADEDFVIGYYDVDNNFVKVVAVVEPVVAGIKKYDRSAATITLTDGTKADAVNAYRLVDNALTAPKLYADDAVVYDAEAQAELLVVDAIAAGNYFVADEYDADEREFYIYNGVLLYDTGVDKTTKFVESLIIPTTNGGDKMPEVEREFKTGEEVAWVYAYVDGEAKYVKVATEDLLPEIINPDSSSYSGYALSSDYENRLCTYDMDGDLYVIKSLGYDVDDDDDDNVVEYEGVARADAMTADEIKAFFNDDEKDDQLYYEEASVSFTKNGSRYYIGLTVDGEDRSVSIKASTKIIVKVTVDAADAEYDYVELTAADITKSIATPLTNVSFIVANNPESKSREDLVVFYAEAADDIELVGTQSKDGYRIVKNYDLGEDDKEGEFRNFYELYNPFTGEVETLVPGTHTAKKAGSVKAPVEAGTVINLIDGMVKDDYTSAEESKFIKANLVDTAAPMALWIAEYDADESTIAVVPVVQNTCKDCVAEYVEIDGFKTDVEDIYGNDIVDGNNNKTHYIDIDKNTSIVVLSNGNKHDTDSFFRWGSMSTVAASALAKPTKEMLCYNNRAFDKNENYVTGYSDFVKCYVSVDTKVDPDENPVAEFIIILVNGEEDAAKNVDCANH